VKEGDLETIEQAKPPWRPTRVISRVVVLGVVMAVAGGIACIWAPHARDLILYSSLACGGFAAVALMIVGLTAGQSASFSGVMVSIAVRTLGPLGALGVLKVQHPTTGFSDLATVFVPMFLVSLTVETILVVDIVSNSSDPATSTGKGRAERKMHG